MNSDPLEGQMTLFETPEKPEKPKSVRKKSVKTLPLETPAKKEANKAAARSKTMPRKANNGKGTVTARPTSGQVPEGDVRLTANIREDLHLKLKIAAAHRRTTIGELIEMLVAKHLK